MAHAENIIATMAPRRLVVKRGRLTIAHERAARERWRETPAG